MIDITVSDDAGYVVVEIEHKSYPVSNIKPLLEMIEDLLDKIKYSGESITLWKAEGPFKNLIKDW
jgi:hypothetical protein